MACPCLLIHPLCGIVLELSGDQKSQLYDSQHDDKYSCWVIGSDCNLQTTHQVLDAFLVDLKLVVLIQGSLQVAVIVCQGLQGNQFERHLQFILHEDLLYLGSTNLCTLVTQEWLLDFTYWWWCRLLRLLCTGQLARLSFPDGIEEDLDDFDCSLLKLICRQLSSSGVSWLG